MVEHIIFWCSKWEADRESVVRSRLLKEARNNNLGILKFNPISSLIKLKHEADYSNSIHTISCGKYFVHYSTPIQCH